MDRIGNKGRTAQGWGSLLWEHLQEPNERTRQRCVVFVLQDVIVFGKMHALSYCLKDVVEVCILHRLRLKLRYICLRSLWDWTEREIVGMSQHGDLLFENLSSIYQVHSRTSLRSIRQYFVEHRFFKPTIKKHVPIFLTLHFPAIRNGSQLVTE